MPDSALFSNGATSVREITADDIDPSSYKDTYKGQLYCTSENCNAKLVVVFRYSRRNYFRTLQNEDHDEDCIHYFERSATRGGIDTQETINVRMSEKQKRNALKRAFSLSQMTDEQIEEMRKKQKNRKKNTTTNNRKDTQTRIEPTLNGEVDEEKEREALKKKKAPSLFNRGADALSESDLGKPRVVSGEVISVYSKKNFAQIKIRRGNTTLSVKFEEAFFADSPNSDGLFGNITKYSEKHGPLIFNGIGEVRVSSTTGEYEVAIFNGNDFTVEGRTLQSLSAIVATWG
ncbi:hypothetical protein SAMN04487936_102156 [Halobacillus dabanensis]|uniref:Uncharacterized protein n=1 Tax=Halobacillus dabanensis TaxID=240302 RepID=A0A1I3RAU8_HALDA|nr:hypothetical protein [Halobacillus dabanensis]SFJ43448.1 hypothetical protein SAMN04487936_102156 [Halobacillus dabanensis]